MRELAAAGSSSQPDTALLHHIAHTIAEHCGHRPLKAHRLAWGWTVKQAVTAFHTMCEHDKLGKRGLGERSWQGWEAGDYRPDDDYLDRLARLFHTNIIKLGYANDHTPPTADDATAHSGVVWQSPTARTPAVLDSLKVGDHSGGLGASVSLVSRLARLRRGVGSMVAEGAMTGAALDDWEQTVRTHGQATRYRPPSALLAELAADFAELQEQMARPHTLTTLRRLTVVTAQMSGLVSLTLLELDENTEARHWARIARNASDEAGDPATQSWVRAQQAFADYYSGNLHAALHAAQAAQAVAGRTICVGGVLAAALEARALAALGRRADACDALRRAQRGLQNLGPESTTASAFSYNEAQFRFHEGNTFTHLRETDAAWESQTRALDLYPDSDYLDRSLVKFDRAVCLAHDGDAESAITIAADVILDLSPEQRSGMIAAKAHGLLAQLTPQQRGIGPARDLHDLLMTAVSQRKV